MSYLLLVELDTADRIDRLCRHDDRVEQRLTHDGVPDLMGEVGHLTGDAMMTRRDGCTRGCLTDARLEVIRVVLEARLMDGVAAYAGMEKRYKVSGKYIDDNQHVWRGRHAYHVERSILTVRPSMCALD